MIIDSYLGRARKLVKKYRGPFRISEVISNDRYNVEEVKGDKKMKNVHAARMKFFYSNEDIVNQSPPDVVSPESTSATDEVYPSTLQTLTAVESPLP